MNTMHLGRFFGLAALAVSLAPAAFAQSYTITDLGTLGGKTAQANAINNAGTVVGQADVDAAGTYHAFAYSNGQMRDLGTLGGTYSVANAINSSGVIVGAAYDAISSWNQAMQSVGGVMTNLGVSSTYPSVAYAVNDSGTIVGEETPGFIAPGYYVTHSFSYANGAVTTPLPSFGSASFTRGINNSGVLVGASNPNNWSIVVPTVTTNGKMTQVGSGYYAGNAFAINNAGTIVGSLWTNDFSSPTYAFSYADGQLKYLYTLGGNRASAQAVNNNGAIVGTSLDASSASCAFLYTSGPMKDLNAFLPRNSGWTLQQANGINDAGWICGYGLKGGQKRAFLLQPDVVVSGRVALEGVNNLAAVSPQALSGGFTIEFRSPGTVTALYSTTINLTPANGGPFGTFSLTAPLAGTFDVAVKGPKNLRVLLPDVMLNAVTAAVPDVVLPAGDANNDNSVDSTDFGLLIGAFNSDSSIPESGYDPTVDFNFDGVVDSTDFGLLIGEFNNVGAN